MRVPILCLLWILLGMACRIHSTQEEPSPPELTEWPIPDWRTASPGEMGMDTGFTAAAKAYLSVRLAHARGVAVIRRGALVLEEYAPGITADSLNDFQSIGKSIMSMLVGMALGQGRLTLDQKVLMGIPGAQDSLIIAPIAEITLEHLLTMTSGIGLEDYPVWSSQSDPIGFSLRCPPANPPGTVFEYSNAAAHVLSAVLTVATGMSVLDFADSALFDPLGVARREWPVDSAGYHTGDGQVRLTLRDMAKLGYLYLRKGRWGNARLISEDWVEKSTSRRTEGGEPENASYGYLWWIGEESGYPAFFAAGWGGQLLQIVPDLDLVVAIASATDSDHPGSRAFLSEVVIPSIAGK